MHTGKREDEILKRLLENAAEQEKTEDNNHGPSLVDLVSRIESSCSSILPWEQWALWLSNILSA